MYRCMICESPAQPGCDCSKAMMQEPDPWGWKEEPVKLDIQAGVRIKEEKDAVCWA